MKRKIIAIILVLCFITLTGCANVNETEENSNSTSVSTEDTCETVDSQENVTSQETEQLTDTENETEQSTATEEEPKGLVGIEAAMQVPEEGLSLMQKVLLNKVEFYGKLEYSDHTTETMSKHKIEEIEGIYYDDMEYTDFYVVDLDRDGTNEICVQYPPGFVMIFHEKDGVVYGYKWVFRSFNPVYSDGTFGGSGGASIDYLYGNVSFEENNFNYETITSIWFEGSGEQHFCKGNPSILTELAGVEISKEEYDEIMSNYPKEEAVCYDFTIENILKYVE